MMCDCVCVCVNECSFFTQSRSRFSVVVRHLIFSQTNTHTLFFSYDQHFNFNTAITQAHAHIRTHTRVPVSHTHKTTHTHTHHTQCSVLLFLPHTQTQQRLLSLSHIPRLDVRFVVVGIQVRVKKIAATATHKQNVGASR